MESKIVLLDRDMYNNVIGLLTVENHTEEEVWKVFGNVKSELDCWTIEDLINGIKEAGWEYSWEENISSMSI